PQRLKTIALISLLPSRQARSPLPRARSMNVALYPVVDREQLGAPRSEPETQREVFTAPVTRGRTCSFSAARKAPVLSTIAACPPPSIATYTFCGAVSRSK